MPERRRMTVALGILASDGIAIAADTQETEGYFKSFALKIQDAMTQTDIFSTVHSAVAVTGSGPAVHLDAVAAEIIKGFHQHQDTELNAFEANLVQCVSDFYRTHVASLPSHLDRDFQLVIGAQIEGKHRLWVTETTVVKTSIGFEAVGSGHPFARIAVQNRGGGTISVETAALLAIRGVMEATEHDQYCGKSTMVTCLKKNLAYSIPWYHIKKAEELFGRYAGIEHSAFLYALGREAGDDAKRPRKVSKWLRDLRQQFTRLSSQLLEDQP